MDDSKYENSFKIILHAGNAKFNYQSAVKAAKENHLLKAKELMEEGDQEFLSAHQFQTELIQQEVRGELVEVNILSVHAQDHLTMASIAKDHANEIIQLYSELSRLKGQIEKLSGSISANNT